MDIYLEIGKKKSFAGAIEWPGWCRSGHDEISALQALAEYAPRYARVMKGQGIAFEAPEMRPASISSSAWKVPPPLTLAHRRLRLPATIAL
jgi:hypothetical protein